MRRSIWFNPSIAHLRSVQVKACFGAGRMAVANTLPIGPVDIFGRRVRRLGAGRAWLSARHPAAGGCAITMRSPAAKRRNPLFHSSLLGIRGEPSRFARAPTPARPGTQPQPDQGGTGRQFQVHAPSSDLCSKNWHTMPYPSVRPLCSSRVRPVFSSIWHGGPAHMDAARGVADMPSCANVSTGSPV